MIRPAPYLETIVPYELADVGICASASLAQNESAFPPGPSALEAAANSFSRARLYPDPDWRELREAIAEVHMLNPKSIGCGAGSMELIGCLIRSFAAEGDEVLGTQFGYAFVAVAAMQARAKYSAAPEANFAVAVDEIASSVRPSTKIVFVCNPGNPTSTAIPAAEIVRLRKLLPDDVILSVDQAYGEFTDPDEQPTDVFGLVKESNTVVFRTLSKAYGLAGARVGWGVFPDNILREVRKLLNPNNVSVFSQAMAAAAIRDQDHMRETVRITSAIRDEFSEQARSLGLDVPPSRTNFVLLQFPSRDLAKAAEQALIEKGLRLRSLAAYGLHDCLRATICPKPVMDRVMEILRTVLE